MGLDLRFFSNPPATEVSRPRRRRPEVWTNSRKVPGCVSASRACRPRSAQLGARRRGPVIWTSCLAHVLWGPSLTLRSGISTLVQSPLGAVGGCLLHIDRQGNLCVDRGPQRRQIICTDFGRRMVPTYYRSVDRGQGQADVPAEQPSSGARPRLPSPDADPCGPRHRCGASP